MSKTNMKSALKKTVLCVALVGALGGVANQAAADTINVSFNGLFTMLDPSGTALQNTSYPYYGDPTWSYGYRTQISGTMSFDTVTGAGSGTVVPFQFFNGNTSLPATAAGISLQAIGDGAGHPGTLILGNMLFNWNGNNGIPVSIVLDGAGFFGAMGQPGFGVGTVISGTGAIPASNGIKKGALPIGPAPVATTTWNTTTVAGAGMGSAISGQLPLIADTIGGSPMIAGPFTGYNANFDITSITVTSIQAVPVPAAVWLFGSGLLGLVGIARRKKA
jgi:hypothetical protein